ncbi:MAG: Dihydropteroate synthase [Hyphomicrobiales bacterium]|nr:Dihydropteroate synthase [Hyphomicrobiales bacterium]
MFDKYMFALGRGVRGVMKGLDEVKSGDAPDPANARDVTPREGAQSEPRPLALEGAPARGVALAFTGRTLLMGIVNVTPDSFSDGGAYLDPAAAIAHGERLAREGADILDVGAESTRPGAVAVSADEEIARAIPVVRALALGARVPVSIDTMKARVAERAIAAGATIVNDVWGFQHDSDMARVVADAGVHCVLMHNRLEVDETLDVYASVRDFLRRSMDIALSAGVREDRIVLDPGVGFGITHAQSFELIRRIGDLRGEFGRPVLLGASRKRCIGVASGESVAAQRVAGSIAAHLWGAMHGADIVRAHDVAQHAQALRVLAAIEGRS